MKKVISVIAAVLLIALSVMPAFAESVNSPTAGKENYIVEIDEVEGGIASFEYVSEVGDDLVQYIKLTAVPNDGYEFAGWIIDDAFVGGDSVYEVAIHGDAKIVPSFVKKGEPKPTTPAKTDDGNKVVDNKGEDNKVVDNKVVDNGSKSPKTGEDFTVYAIFAVSAIALASVIAVAKRRSTEK